MLFADGSSLEQGFTLLFTNLSSFDNVQMCFVKPTPGLFEMKTNTLSDTVEHKHKERPVVLCLV